MTQQTKMITLILTIAAILLLTSSCSTPPTAPGTEAKLTPPENANWADYYPHEKGTSWEYDAEVYEGDIAKAQKFFYPGFHKLKVTDTKTSNGKYIFVEEIEHQGKFVKISYSSIDKNGISSIGDIYFKGGKKKITKYPVPILYLKFPIKIGSKWTWEGKIDGGQIKEDKEIKSYETVDTPAGKFNAFKIDCTITDKDGETAISTWYAEGIGRVKQDALIKYNNVRIIYLLKKYEIKK